MAQGNQSLIHITPEIWAAACSDAGYALNDGLPVLGISGDDKQGVGFLVTLGVPTHISPVNLARALCSYALRVGQAKVKAEKEPTRQTAIDGANSALRDYKPERTRENDILEKEAQSRFKDYIRGLVVAQDANASDAVINATYDAEKEKESGKAWIKDQKAKILAAGTYTVARKNATKGAAIAVVVGVPESPEA